jgi:hypothetical protein
MIKDKIIKMMAEKGSEEILKYLEMINKNQLKLENHLITIQENQVELFEFVGKNLKNDKNKI